METCRSLRESDCLEHDLKYMRVGLCVLKWGLDSATDALTQEQRRVLYNEGVRVVKETEQELEQVRREEQE